MFFAGPLVCSTSDFRKERAKAENFEFCGYED